MCKIKLALICLLTFSILNLPSSIAQITTSEQIFSNEKAYIDEIGQRWTEEEILRWIEADKETDPSLGKYVGQDFGHYAIVANAIQSDTIVNLLIEFPVVHINTLEAQLMCFRIIGDQYHLDKQFRDRMEEIVREAVTNDVSNVRYNAAYLLAYWGDWELAEQYLESVGEYPNLAKIEGPRTEEFLTRIALDLKKDPHARMSAAYELKRLTGEEDVLLQASIGIVASASTTTQDGADIRGYYTALRYLGKTLNSSSISAIERLAYQDNFLVSDQALLTIKHMAEKGSIEAENALFRIRENHPSQDFRSRAGMYIP